MCNQPSNGSGGGQGGAEARGERGRASCARLGEPADRAREGEPEEARAGTRARAGPAQASPARPPLLSLLPSPGGAGREHKDFNFRAGAGPPRQLLAQARPARRTRPGNARRPGTGAEGPGQRHEVCGGRCGGGRGPGVTPAAGTPRMAEKRVSKNRQQPARRGGWLKKNKEQSPAPLRRSPWLPLTRAERSGESRAARKEAVPPHSGAEGRERRRKKAAPAAA